MANRCPKCGSYNTETHYAMKTAGIIFDVIVAIASNGKTPSNGTGATTTHSCKSCGHKWGW